MSFDLNPAELLACALAAALIAVPVAFPLAAGIVTAPRHTWSRAGLAMGVGLLFGVVFAGATVLMDPGALVPLAGVGLLLGLACAIAAAVLIVVLDDGTFLATAVGILACVLIGIGEPVQTVQAMTELSSSVLVVLAAVVVEAVVLVSIVGFLVAAAGRVRALQIGVAAGGAVAAAILGVGVLLHLISRLGDEAPPAMPVTAALISALIAFVLGAVASGVLGTVRARQRAAGASEEI